jgi:rod shape determining protein RodA
MYNLFNRFKYFDLPLLVATLILVVSGGAILYGTTLSQETHEVFYRQVVFLTAGLGGFLFFSFFDYHNLAKINRAIYVILFSLLFYTLIFGLAVKGGRRWIDFGIGSFQPAEFIKLSIILGLSRLLYLKRGQINSLKTLVWSILYAALPALFVAAQPDLGSAIIIMGLWLGIIFLSPIKKKYLVILFIIFLIGAGVAWKFLLKDFQKSRIEVFINPNLDPRGRGYNVKQAAIAVGAGQIFGRGLGKGVQSQSKFLPERQTDFIFAASSEEIGFVGSTTLLLLYFFLFFRLLTILKRAKDDLGMYLAGGVLFLFFFQVLINVGMNLGIMPVTGIPLPFVSAGGSSLVVSLLALGVAQNISVQSKALRF